MIKEKIFSVVWNAPKALLSKTVGRTAMGWFTKSFWATFVPEWHFYKGGSEAKNWVEQRLH